MYWFYLMPTSFWPTDARDESSMHGLESTPNRNGMSTKPPANSHTVHQGMSPTLVLQIKQVCCGIVVARRVCGIVVVGRGALSNWYLLQLLLSHPEGLWVARFPAEFKVHIFMSESPSL